MILSAMCNIGLHPYTSLALLLIIADALVLQIVLVISQHVSCHVLVLPLLI